MSKIIKPKLNPDGSQAIRKLQKGDWYYNSNINTFQEYIHQEFSNLNMKAFEVIKRIRLAKLEKKFGVSDFSVFMNIKTGEYGNFYKHELKSKEYIDPEIGRLNNEIIKKQQQQ